MDIKNWLIILGVVFVISIFVLIKLKKEKRLGVLLFSTFTLTAISALLFLDIFPKINYGLDLKGGFEVLYNVKPLDDKKLDKDMVYSTYKTILKRIDVLGVSEPEITIEGEDRIRIRLAGVTNESEAKEILSSTATLSFRDTSDNLLMTSSVLGGSVKVSTDQSGRPAVALQVKDVTTFYNVTKKISGMQDNRIVIWLDFEDGVDSFEKESAVCGRLSTSRCLSAATVSQAFASDVIISGSFSLEEAKNLASLINSGAMPTKLSELSSRTVPATYGEEALNKTIFAGAVGIVIIMILMIALYRFSGFIASICIVIYTAMTFLIFSWINGVLTLPGIAALLLGIGMAIDSCFISLERVKEELKKGKSLEGAFKEGNKLSITSIIDANVTTIIVAIILFIFGVSSIKGFATMLTINVFITLIVMVYLMRFILNLFVQTGFFENHINLFLGMTRKMRESKKIPYQRLEFVKSFKWFIILPIFITVFGVFTTFTKGVNLGVDFTGGTQINISINDKYESSAILDDLRELGYSLEKEEKTSNNYSILIKEVLTSDETKELNKKFEEKYDRKVDIYVVSDTVKKELTKNGIISLLLASIGIILYVTIRFKFSYAISGIIALVHDVIMTVALFIIFGIEIDSIFIAAILTIIGYSINDTIVTFDRIRENYKNIHKNVVISNEVIDNLVNDSVREMFFRTILTSVSTLIPVTVMVFFGTHEILNFNLALLFGFVFGVYSSIFISNKMWAELEKRRLKKGPKLKVKKKDEPEELLVKGINS